MAGTGGGRTSAWVVGMCATALAALWLATMSGHAHAQAGGRFDGSYEYVSPNRSGVLRVETAESGVVFFHVGTASGPVRCEVLGAGFLQGNAIVHFTPGQDTALIIRFHESNAEIESPGGEAVFCGAPAQISGIYIRVGDEVEPDAALIGRAQAGLNALGYDAGPADGRPGPRSTAAVAGFQRANGIPAGGSWTIETLFQIERQVESPEAAALPATATMRPVDWHQLSFTRDIPPAYRDDLSELFADDLAPVRIDWTNPPFEVSVMELDDRGGGLNAEEIIVYWNDVMFCGSIGCALEVLKYDGSAYQPILRQTIQSVVLGDSFSNGMRDLIVNGSHMWRWDGTRYIPALYVPRPVR